MMELKRNDQRVYRILEEKKNFYESLQNAKRMEKKPLIQRRIRLNDFQMERFMSRKSNKKDFINPLYEFFFNHTLFKVWKRYTMEKLQKFEHFESEDEEEEEEN